MNEPSIIRVELDLSAQKVLHQFQIHNEQISADVQKGIERAVKEFDFEAAIAAKGKKLIEEVINNFMWNSELRKAIQAKVDLIVTDLLNKQFENTNL